MAPQRYLAVFAGLSLVVAACAPATPSPATAPAPPAATTAPAKSEPTPATKPAASPAVKAEGKAASSSAATTSYPEYLRQLEEGARQEGKLVIYSTSTVEPGQLTTGERMKKKYPWLEIEEVLEASGSRLLERMLLEIQAGRAPDVADLGSGQMGDLRSRGLLAEYRTPLQEQYIDEYEPKHNFWTATGFRSLHNIYNTNNVQQNDVTDQWETILDPKFKGQTGIDVGGTFYQAWTALELRRGESQAAQFMQKLGDNDARPYFSNSQIRNLVASGELSFGILMYLDNILLMQQQGAPLELWNPDPVVLFPSVSGILKNSQHPNAAKLYVEWALDPEVQRELAEEQYTVPARADVENPHPEYFEGVTFVVAGPDETEPRLEPQRSLYEQYFRIPPVKD